VKLARRKTGGGAVYQDLGNTCFSFLTPYEPNQNYDYRSINNEILISCLKRLGVNAQVSGRNDITVDGRKVIRHNIIDFRICVSTAFRRKGWGWQESSPSWNCVVLC
jgi:hypothetical protein